LRLGSILPLFLSRSQHVQGPVRPFLIIERNISVHRGTQILGRFVQMVIDLEEIRAKTERLRQEAEERVAQMRLEVAENLEPTRSVKNEIIEKQDALIRLLYREEDASPEIRELKQEIETKKAVLEKRCVRLLKL